MRPTLVYLHGFLSSPQSLKARMVADYVRQQRLVINMVAPPLPDAPAAALAAADAVVAAVCREGQVALIGSSMGGFYATVLAERYDLRAVLINPSVLPSRRLQRYYGIQRNPYTGRCVHIGPADAAELRQMAPARITPAHYWLLVQTGDEVLDYREAMAWYEGSLQTVESGGDHRFAGFKRHLPGILKFLQCVPAGAAPETGSCG